MVIIKFPQQFQAISGEWPIRVAFRWCICREPPEAFDRHAGFHEFSLGYATLGCRFGDRGKISRKSVIHVNVFLQILAVTIPMFANILKNKRSMLWDERYDREEYAYGKEPNDFLKDHIDMLPAGRTLCIAEGEGRNAVYLASRGHRVTAVDQSLVGLEKARQFAQERYVRIETVHTDLAHFRIFPRSWDVIVSIFAHVPPPLRRVIHREAVAGLRPGGVFVLEAYTPEQLKYKTGGPPVEEMMMTLETLKAEGCATIEIKSGYGLDVTTETRLLAIARELGRTAGRYRELFGELPSTTLASSAQRRGARYLDLLGGTDRLNHPGQ